MTIADSRPSVEEVLLHIAEAWAARATCARAHIGCVIAVHNRIVSSGYNGAPARMPHCDCAGPNDPRWELNAACPVSVHAEANAIAFAAKSGISTDGGTLYTTMMPCTSCAMLIINSGIVRVVSRNVNVRDPHGENLLELAGLQVWLLAT